MRKHYKSSFTPVFTILIMVLMACTRHTSDPRLLAINRTIEESPNKALSELKKINPDSLDKDSRHIRDLLIIKASDKAYITHTSDSLILDVLDYFESHKEDPYYPEALYYGGRVYSDLGDLPTALDFFRKAADNLPVSNDHLKFRANILSQTGNILNRLRLHDEANTYLTEVVDIDHNLKDTSTLPEDVMALVYNHIYNNNFSLANNLIVETLKNDGLPEEKRRNLFVLLAVTKYKTENVNEALRIIQNEGKALTNDESSDILAYRAQIYYRAGMLDSAYVMAKRLIHHSEYINKRIGYRILISPEIRPRIPIDSLNHYIDEYSDGMESYLDENANQAALMQQTSYNYSKHVRSQEETSQVNSSLIKWVLSLVFLLLISNTLSFLCFGWQRKKIRLLRHTLEDLSHHKDEEITSLRQKLKDISVRKDKEVGALNRQLVEQSNQKNEEIAGLRQKIMELFESKNGNTPDNGHTEKTNPLILNNADPTGMHPASSVNNRPSINELRSDIKNKLKTFIDNNEELPAIPSEILNSNIYSFIQSRLNDKKPIKDDDDSWEQIRNLITTISPEFIKTINMLSGGNLSSLELQTVLLIRLGMQPQQLATLTNRGKSTMVARRKAISKKILDEEIAPQNLDILIRIL